MRKLFSFLLLTIASTLAGQAITVDVTPGTLSQIIDDDVTITELVLTGTMDARDFNFISEKLNNLTTLDLSQVTIVPYSNSTPVYSTYVNYFGNEIPRTAFFGKPLTSVVLPANIEGIGYAAFAGCDQLQSVVIPASVTYIEDYAFAGTGLTSIDLPSTVGFMGDGVFSRCTALTSANINSKGIGCFAFLGDTALAQVAIGANVGYINEGAFNGCTALTTVNFDPKCSLSRIGDEAFINSGLETLNIKSIRLGTLGDWALAQTQLRRFELTDGLMHLGVGALAHNPYLADVTLPGFGKVNSGNSNLDAQEKPNDEGLKPFGAPGMNKKLSRIGAYAFADDSLLNTGRMMRTGIGGIQVIEPYAFYNNSLEMDTMYLPASVRFLGDSAMAGMTGMHTFKVDAENVPELGMDVWAGVNQPSIPLITPSAEAESLYKEADQWMYFFFAPSFLLGDVNNDGLVNIADVTDLIDYILTGNDEFVNVLAADVDQDGVVSISDVTTLIDAILTGASLLTTSQIEAELESKFPTTSDALVVEPISLKAGETRTINVMLNNDEFDYTALQCEIVLPQGVELNSVDAVERGNNHSCYLRKNVIDENVYSLMGVSGDNSLFAGSEGKILSLTVTASDEFDATAAQIEFANIMLVTDKSSIYLAGNTISKLNENTAVEQLNSDKQVAKVTYINVSGQQSDKAFDGMNIVVTTYTDGTTSTTKVIK